MDSNFGIRDKWLTLANKLCFCAATKSSSEAQEIMLCLNIEIRNEPTISSYHFYCYNHRFSIGPYSYYMVFSKVNSLENLWMGVTRSLQIYVHHFLCASTSFTTFTDDSLTQITLHSTIFPQHK